MPIQGSIPEGTWVRWKEVMLEIPESQFQVRSEVRASLLPAHSHCPSLRPCPLRPPKVSYVTKTSSPSPCEFRLHDFLAAMAQPSTVPFVQCLQLLLRQRSSLLLPFTFLFFEDSAYTPELLLGSEPPNPGPALVPFKAGSGILVLGQKFQELDLLTAAPPAARRGLGTL